MKKFHHFISLEELQPQLRKLQLAAENGEIEKIRNLMKLLVTDYTPEKKRRRFSIFGTNKEIIWNKHEH